MRKYNDAHGSLNINEKGVFEDKVLNSLWQIGN